MESDHTPPRQVEIADDEALRNLLARLNEADFCEPGGWIPVSRSEKVTVEDVAEALHLDPNYVARELEAMHQEHRDARLAGMIRELEEPLYRVERTGHAAPDPLGNPLYKLRSVQILAERNKSKPILPRREEKVSASERISQLVGHTMLYLMLGLLLLLVAKVAIAAMMAR